MSAINCISIFTWPSPWHTSQRPPSTLKREVRGFEAPRLGQRLLGKQRAGWRRRPSRRSPGWSATLADGVLVHELDVASPGPARPSGGRTCRCLARPPPPSCLRQRRGQNALHQRRLARARHARDHRHHAQRKLHREVLEVVFAGARSLPGRCARGGARWAPAPAMLPAQVLAGVGVVSFSSSG